MIRRLCKVVKKVVLGQLLQMERLNKTAIALLFVKYLISARRGRGRTSRAGVSRLI